MIPYWLQLVASTGATAIIVYGSIFNIPRSWLRSKSSILDDFLTCTLCIGFWSGFVLSHFTNENYTQHIIIGLASSACSWLYDSIVGVNQAQEVKLTKEINLNK